MQPADDLDGGVQNAADPNCTFYPQTGFSVCGAIRDKYNALGGSGGFMGFPTSNELTNPDGVGKRNTFQTGSSIYWSPNTPASQIGGAIFAKWGNFGYESGPLGYPISDELTNVGNLGKRNIFQNYTNMIYWSAATGAHQIGGTILQKWASQGFEISPLGYPTTDEITTPDGVGRFNRFFLNNASIYWTPATAAHTIMGTIYSKWADFGYENGILGYPTTDQMAHSDNRGAHNLFSKAGGIWWSPTTGAHQLSGTILTRWGQRGYETSTAGYPTTDEIANTGPSAMFPNMGSRRNDFEAGAVYGGDKPAYYATWWGMARAADGSMSMVPPTMTPYQMANYRADSAPAASTPTQQRSAAEDATVQASAGNGENCPTGTTNYPDVAAGPFLQSDFNCVAVYNLDNQGNYDDGVRRGVRSAVQGIRDTAEPVSKGFGITHADKDHNVTLHDVGILAQGFPAELQTVNPAQNRFIRTAYFGDDEGPTALTSISAVIQRVDDLEGNAPDDEDMGLITAYCNAGMIGPRDYVGFCPDNLPTVFAVGGRNLHGEGQK